jgi:CRP-like cAMP-binding protein
LEESSLLAWTSGEVEQQTEQQPRLGFVLAQHLIRECTALQDRIENGAHYRMPERVMLAIMELAKSLGRLMPDGSMRLHPLTHQTIGEYVGTSREVVTFQMNRLRRLGILSYSRRYLDVDLARLQDTLAQQGVALPRTARNGNHKHVIPTTSAPPA